MRRFLLVIVLEAGLICIAVVVDVMTGLMPLWTWATGAVVFFVVIPLALYWRECRVWLSRRIAPVAQIAEGDGQDDSDLERLKACLPYVQRCRELIRPFAGPSSDLETRQKEIQAINSGGVQIIELMMEVGYLSEHLNALDIQCPVLTDLDDRPDISRYVKLKLWSFCLAQLEVMIRQGDLTGARGSFAFGTVGPRTPDKKDDWY